MKIQYKWGHLLSISSCNGVNISKRGLVRLAVRWNQYKWMCAACECVCVRAPSCKTGQCQRITENSFLIYVPLLFHLTQGTVVKWIKLYGPPPQQITPLPLWEDWEMTLLYSSPLIIKNTDAVVTFHKSSLTVQWWRVCIFMFERVCLEVEISQEITRNVTVVVWWCVAELFNITDRTFLMSLWHFMTVLWK